MGIRTWETFLTAQGTQLLLTSTLTLEILCVWCCDDGWVLYPKDIMGSSGPNFKRNSNVFLEVSRFQMKREPRGWSQQREDEESEPRPWMRSKSRIILSAELLPTNEKKHIFL